MIFRLQSLYHERILRLHELAKIIVSGAPKIRVWRKKLLHGALFTIEVSACPFQERFRPNNYYGRNSEGWLNGRLIFRSGNFQWSARWPDFIVSFFCMSRVNVNKPQTLYATEENIRQEFENLVPEMLVRVMENAITWPFYVIDSGGGHLNNSTSSTSWKNIYDIKLK